jgi:hypothetical protein
MSSGQHWRLYHKKRKQGDTMARYFTEKISKEQLEQKIVSIVKTNSKKNYANTEYYDYNQLTSQVSKDLSKVQFDAENISDCDLYLNSVQHDGQRYLGYNTLGNGLSYLGVNAGGDWETPVFFMLYWDGKSIRGYVPKDGNTWNTHSKEAFGNDEENDIIALKELGMYKEHGSSYGADDLKCDFDKMMTEIQQHITYKEK